MTNSVKKVMFPAWRNFKKKIVVNVIRIRETLRQKLHPYSILRISKRLLNSSYACLLKLHNWGHTNVLCCLNNTTMAFSRQFLLQIENRLCIIDPFRFFFCILLWFHEIFLLCFHTVVGRIVWNDRQIPKIDETGWNWCDLAWKLETPKLRSVTLDIHKYCLPYFFFFLFRWAAEFY